MNKHGDHRQLHCCFLRCATETKYFTVGVFPNKDHELSTGVGWGGPHSHMFEGRWEAVRNA